MITRRGTQIYTVAWLKINISGEKLVFRDVQIFQRKQTTEVCYRLEIIFVESIRDRGKHTFKIHPFPTLLVRVRFFLLWSQNSVLTDHPLF